MQQTSNFEHVGDVLVTVWQAEGSQTQLYDLMSCQRRYETCDHTVPTLEPGNKTVNYTPGTVQLPTAAHVAPRAGTPDYLVWQPKVECPEPICKTAPCTHVA